MGLREQDYKKILSYYNIGQIVSFDDKTKSFDESVYFFKTTKGKFVIKFFNKLKIKRLKYQFGLIDYLYSKKLPVIKNILAKNGKDILKFKEKYFVIQGFVNGKEDLDMLSDKLIKDISLHFAKMHKALLKLKLKKVLDKSRYKKLNFPMDKIYDYVKLFQNYLFGEIDNLSKSRVRISHIHGDISNVNFMVKGQKLVAFIDWDDAHCGYLVYDIANFIAHNFVKRKKIDENKIKLFMDNYGKIMNLNEYEKQFLYYLIGYRLLVILHWYTSRFDRKGINTREFNEGIKRSIERIKRFVDFSLREFLQVLSKS